DNFYRVACWYADGTTAAALRSARNSSILSPEVPDSIPLSLCPVPCSLWRQTARRSCPEAPLPCAREGRYLPCTKIPIRCRSGRTPQQNSSDREPSAPLPPHRCPPRRRASTQFCI